jgi:magnesium-transporting ATPase (P-type)
VYLENRQDNQFILGVGCFLIVLTILTAIFTFTLTPRSPESEKHLIPPSSKVLRDGKIVQIPWKEIVLGDIVEFIAGEAFPADIRIIRSL